MPFRMPEDHAAGLRRDQAPKGPGPGYCASRGMTPNAMTQRGDADTGRALRLNSVV